MRRHGSFSCGNGSAGLRNTSGHVLLCHLHGAGVRDAQEERRSVERAGNVEDVVLRRPVGSWAQVGLTLSSEFVGTDSSQKPQNPWLQAPAAASPSKRCTGVRIRDAHGARTD